mmetsp:Transcript_342/g.983  ORF Transcript_342/g.983 Transcript_342/m.983 type:complete len:223 (-) Transcript_342:62-730(-)
MVRPDDKSSSLSKSPYSLALGWWMVVMMLRPPVARPRSVATSCSAVVLSSPLVGSSSRSTDGLMRSSCPTETRLRSPPDTPRWKYPPMRVLRHLERPSAFKTVVTRSVCSAMLMVRGSRRRAAKYSVSHTVSASYSRSSCKTNPTCRLARLVMGLPLYKTCPLTSTVFGTRPPMMDSSDVFPDPLGPMSARSSPGRQHPLTPSSTMITPGLTAGLPFTLASV